MTHYNIDSKTPPLTNKNTITHLCWQLMMRMRTAKDQSSICVGKMEIVCSFTQLVTPRGCSVTYFALCISLRTAQLVTLLCVTSFALCFALCDIFCTVSHCTLHCLSVWAATMWCDIFCNALLHCGVTSFALFINVHCLSDVTLRRFYVTSFAMHWASLRGTIALWEIKVQSLMHCWAVFGQQCNCICAIM